jgi:hypothetical protein
VFIETQAKSTFVLWERFFKECDLFQPDGSINDACEDTSVVVERFAVVTQIL